MSLHINRISLEHFNTALKRYHETASSALIDLDTQRYDTIPAQLAKSKRETHLLKADVEKLVEWKLKHGTFRPSLMKLVQSNPADVIASTTQAGFASVTTGGDVMKSLKILTALRGIGPATASLLLSVYNPDEIPFFSDELFRWTQWDATGKGHGWDRVIKYNVSEYKELHSSIEALRKRLGVKAVDAEKVAYVLGKERAEVGAKVKPKSDTKDVLEEKVQGKIMDTEKPEDAQKESRKRVKEALKEIRRENTRKSESKGAVKEAAVVDDSHKKGTKRKAKEEQTPTEGTRKSTRRKA